MIDERPLPPGSEGLRSVGAAVDLGSNSVHLLVAGVADHRLDPLVDESVFLGLGRAVDAEGHLGPAARAALVEALIHYTEIARGLGARAITFVGTEPLRRAADSAMVVHEVQAATGVPLHVLTHEEEAYLTVVGVMAGRLVEQETLIVDIGGGSSEFCVVGPSEPPRASGLKLGSNRLTSRHVSGDPPTRAEMEAMIAEAAAVLDTAPDTSPAEIVAVGGTASNLLKVVPDALLDLVLTRARIVQAMDILENETAAEAVERHVVKPARARILPAGAAIMDALLTRYGVGRIRVSDAGIREGAILVVDHVGVAWRDQLADLAHGWRA
jgi:exopolyphosphatase/pppGpp-phosphohydrolase